MIVLIPIEIASRELLFKVFLCHCLTLKGFTCYLGKKSFIWHLAREMEGYLYIDKGYHEGHSEKIYKLVRSKSGYIVSLDEEGAVDFSDNKTLLKRYSKSVFQSLDQVFLWGKGQFDILKNNIQDTSKVSITGHPRFELLKPKYNFFYEKEVNKIKDKYGDFILINTNMGFGNNIKGDDFIRDRMDGYGNWFKDIDRIIEQDKIKMDEYISLVKILSKESDRYIIFRPHPEENNEKYFKAFSNYPKVIITNKGSVVPWLMAASIMIHPDCTTSIESLIIGKKSISFIPKSSQDDLVTDLPLKISHRAENIEAIISIINSDNNLIINQNDKSIVDNFFSTSLDSSFLIVEKIVELFNGKIDLNKTSISIMNYLWLNYRAVKFKFSPGKSATLAKKKIFGFSKNNIWRYHQNCIKMNAEFSKVHPKKIADNLYQFSLKNPL